MSLRVQKNLSLTVMTILHFFVDLICAITLLMRFSVAAETMLYLVLTYNFVAFMLQPFLGFLLDRFEKRVDERIIVASSFLLLFIIAAIAPFTRQYDYLVILAGIVLGLGNAFFHVAAGKSVLKATTKSRDGGIFVSSGALGIALGAFLYFLNNNYLAIAILGASFIAVTYLAWMLVSIGRSERTKDFVVEKHGISETAVILVLIALAAFLRSFGGSAFQTSSIGTAMEISVIIGAGAFIGKFIGGFVYDWFKGLALIITSFVLTVGSLITMNFVTGDLSLLFLFIFGIGVNLLMAYTLDVSKRLLPKHEGTAFGLPAALLFPGMLLALLYKTANLSNLYLLIFIVINIALVVVAEYFIRKHKYDSSSTANR